MKALAYTFNQEKALEVSMTVKLQILRRIVSSSKPHNHPPLQLLGCDMQQTLEGKYSKLNSDASMVSREGRVQFMVGGSISAKA